MNYTKLIDLRFLRFLLTGGFNTGVTYVLYLVLLKFLPYIWSYSVSYICGIVLAFALSRFFVFKEHRGLRSVLFFPLVYVAQYLFGILVIWFWVKNLQFSQELAPLAAIALSLPLTYFLTKIIFVKSEKKM
jgi:putative flippase GtrA